MEGDGVFAVLSLLLECFRPETEGGPCERRGAHEGCAHEGCAHEGCAHEGRSGCPSSKGGVIR